jgi:DNA-binding transcriptional ArsR family regulator
MNKMVLATTDTSENGENIVYLLRPEFNKICYNPIRASMIHLLFKSRSLNYTLSVEELAYKLGKRHSVIVHHLEKLYGWKIVDIVRSFKYGDKNRRSIWGLNMKHPNLVQEVYSHMLKNFYTVKGLDEMCSANRNVRHAS